jgi:CHAT domain-containing protein
VADVATERALSPHHVGLLKPLAHAHAELSGVAALFRPRSRVSELERATEQALRDDVTLERASIVHIATHGLIDEASPDRSALALTATAPDDGLLQVREIYGLRLRAALVTLSACRTALGKDVTGEGMVGLTRAFFYAGAGSVLASLWNLNDQAASQWMTRFYGEVRRGAPIDRAAQRAKLAFLTGDPRLRHPYYWAPFVLSGDAGVTIPPVLSAVAGPPSRAVRQAIGAALLLGTAAGYVIVQRKRRRTGAAAM